MDLWPAIYPKRTLNPAFREAVRLSMANANKARWQRLRGEVATVHGYSGPVLTTLANFTHQSELSRVLHADKVAASPRTIARLEALARAVGFTGDVFDPTDEPVAEDAMTAQGAAL